jgi:hypothetical protein
MYQLGRKPFHADAARLQVQEAYNAQALVPHLIRGVVSKESIADNVATALFTVTTTDETGDNDAGAYLVIVEGLIGHAARYPTAVNTAVKRFRAAFSRAMLASGSGVLSAVSEDHDDTLIETDAAQRSIGNVTLTVAETSEYVTTASITIDLTGAAVGTAQAVIEVTLTWMGFSTAPAIAPA